MERWVPLNDHPGYFISDHGRIRHGDRLRKLQLDRHGYHRIGLRLNGKAIFPTVHRLVALHFCGECPPGYACAHLDGSRTNNHWQNLAFVTVAENNRHTTIHGTRARGEKHGRRKLTEDDVVRIRSTYVRGSSEYGSYALGREYGVDPKTITRLCSGECWGHLRAARAVMED
jgi:hypothetical protein